MKLLQTTTNDENTANFLMQKALENALCACVFRQEILSSYLWEDKICKDKEILLSFKTRKKSVKKLKKFILKHHNYEVCELIVSKAKILNPAYKKWLKKALISS